MGKDQELLEAARNGNIPVVEKILNQRSKRSGPLASLRRGPGANVQDSSGYSALHHAALNGHKEVVQLLLTHEASTNIVDVKGSSPLHLAAWTGNVDIVRLLLCHGPSVPNVNLTTKDNETALHCAAQYGHTAVVSQLLEHSCDPTIRNSREETALDLAGQYGRLETVELLVRTHPELLQPFSRRGAHALLFPHTPLHLASRNGHKTVVEVLLSAGLDVNVRTGGGTALHEAALCGKVEVVRTLLDAGVDLGARDAQRNTVMDLLGQFPKHVTQDITDIIKNHRCGAGTPRGGVGSSGSRAADPEDRDSASHPPLPPIPVPDASGLGSPYENVRVIPQGRRRGMEDSSPGTSPTQWEFYHNSGGERMSGASIASGSTADGVFYQSPPVPKALSDGNYLSEDLSPYHQHHHHHHHHHRDPDQMSVSSATSSTGGVYMPMVAGHAHSPGSNSKVSPTPPKKPPRRNLSVSPTHLQPTMTMSADGGSLSGSGGGGSSAYEYLFLARSGVRSQCDLEEMQGHPGAGRREALLRQGRSVDQYVDMKLRHSLLHTSDSPQGFSMRGRGEESDENRKPQLVNAGQHQPVAITSMYENVPIRTTNPRRKLRRHYTTDRAYENYEPIGYSSEAPGAGGNSSLSASPSVTASGGAASEGENHPKFVSSAYITFKSSQESLLEEGLGTARRGSAVTPTGRKGVAAPSSPTHYQQPPTPDHPPPSALQAEKSIQDRIRPLSQEYKRRSKDMETETEDDLLLFPGSLDAASSGSLSSSVSLSDKSVSTDNNVEEFLGDVPFAGLFKGSTSQGQDGPRAERPKTLRRLRNVYEGGGGGGGGGGVGLTEDGEEVVCKRPGRGGGCPGVSGGAGDKSLSILSPFDEQEEWAKISEIMASFGSGLARDSVFVSELEKEFQSRMVLTHSSSNSPIVGSSVGQWLASLGLAEYESLFHNNGFDDLDFINGVIEAQDLKDMGLNSDSDINAILGAAQSLPCKVNNNLAANKNNNNSMDAVSTADGSVAVSPVETWLKSIHLDCYVDTFHKHLYKDMERVRRIWEVELTAVLEIHKAGHRRRILTSVSGHQQPGPNLEDINADLNQLKSNIQQLKEEIREKLPATNTGTLRHSHKKSRPPPPPVVAPSTNGSAVDLEIREPSELLVGVPATLTTQWRHRPHALVTGIVTYVANYLGSTVVKELRGTESTKKSIQKLKRSTRESKSTPDIVLAISYRGVQFLNTLTQELVCEHEIRNIHCACQDADDLTHFAYITKDHTSKSHYCHVFCVQTMDQATEVIMTLGQAFEVAYQMALREQFSSASPLPRGGHTRSQSANILATPPVSTHTPVNHTRSLSVNEVKVNGQQVKEMSQTSEEQQTMTSPLQTPKINAPIVQTEEL